MFLRNGAVCQQVRRELQHSTPILTVLKGVIIIWSLDKSRKHFRFPWHTQLQTTATDSWKFPHNFHANANVNIYVFVTVTVLLSLRISSNVWCSERVFCHISCCMRRCVIFICPLTPPPPPSRRLTRRISDLPRINQQSSQQLYKFADRSERHP